MRIGVLKKGSGKSVVINALGALQNTIAENTDVKLGYSFYRGRIYSGRDDVVHLDLLGADIDGRYRVISLRYDVETGDFLQPVDRGIVNLGVIGKAIVNFLDSLEAVSTVFSQIVFDFNSKYDVDGSKCFIYEDLNEPGSCVMMVETDPYMVDTYMLKDAADRCEGTVLCEKFGYIHHILYNLDTKNAAQVSFLKKRGIRVV